MGRTVEGLTASMDLKKKWQNKKQKARFSITDITNHDIRKLFKQFKNSSDIGYKRK